VSSSFGFQPNCPVGKRKRLMKRAQLIDPLETTTSSPEDNITDISMLLTRALDHIHGTNSLSKTTQRL
jgi:hypothetical protein